MMKQLTINLPDWVEEEHRSIYVLAGIELVAYRVPGESWKIKIGRCNMCGKCCMNLKKHVFPLIDGKCVYLQKEPGNNPMWRCGLGIRRPFGCCVGVPQKVPECTEKYKEA